MRFDEVELEAVPLATPLPDMQEVVESAESHEPTRLRRFLATLIDVSLFAALALALSPLLPDPATVLSLAALAGFVLVLSYYYFVGAWMLWGRTIGAAIFDVKMPAETLATASRRWAVLLAVVVVVGIAARLAWQMGR